MNVMNVDVPVIKGEKEARKLFLHHLGLAIAYWEGCENDEKLVYLIQRDLPDMHKLAALALHKYLLDAYKD